MISKCRRVNFLCNGNCFKKNIYAKKKLYRKLSWQAKKKKKSVLLHTEKTEIREAHTRAIHEWQSCWVSTDGHIVKFQYARPAENCEDAAAREVLLRYRTHAHGEPRSTRYHFRAGGAASSRVKGSSAMHDDTRSARVDASFSVRVGVAMITAKCSSRVLRRPLPRVFPLSSRYCDICCYCACKGLGTAAETVCARCLSNGKPAVRMHWSWRGCDVRRGEVFLRTQDFLRRTRKALLVKLKIYILYAYQQSKTPANVK